MKRCMNIQCEIHMKRIYLSLNVRFCRQDKSSHELNKYCSQICFMSGLLKFASEIHLGLQLCRGQSYFIFCFGQVLLTSNKV